MGTQCSLLDLCGLFKTQNGRVMGEQYCTFERTWKEAVIAWDTQTGTFIEGLRKTRDLSG
jgi:hypothetical protein